MIERIQKSQDPIVLLLVIFIHGLFLFLVVFHQNQETIHEKIELLQAELIPPAKKLKEIPAPKEIPKTPEKKLLFRRHCRLLPKKQNLKVNLLRTPLMRLRKRKLPLSLIQRVMQVLKTQK
jgi:hypothetical protein